MHRGAHHIRSYAAYLIWGVPLSPQINVMGETRQPRGVLYPEYVAKKKDRENICLNEENETKSVKKCAV